MRTALVSAVAAVAGLAAAASAQSITTLFQSNNGGSAGGGVYFQIVVGANPIQVTGFDMNTSTLGTLGFRAFTTPNTHSGNEANPAAWTMVANGTATGMGIDIPSPVSLNNTFVLNANTSYGIALTLSDTGATSGALRYSGTGTNPAPGLPQYSNADLTLNLGTSTNVLFSGSAFNPRIFNGTINYTVVTAPASLALLGLGGLVAARRRR
jgi:hypothetical protein